MASTVVKIIKGFGATIGSTEGYSSFTFSPIQIELTIEIDPTTAEGLATLNKICDELFKISVLSHERDVRLLAERYPELKTTLIKKQSYGF